MRLFRITQQQNSVAAFDGVGSSLYPGRWNERTTRVVYVTSSIALGLLEVIVQATTSPLLDYLAYPVDIPDAFLEPLEQSALSANWRTVGAGRDECRRHGETWRRAGTSLGLIVPSAVIPEAFDFGDFNVVLNPAHGGMKHATIGASISLALDDRLRTRGISLLPGSPRVRKSAVATRRRGA